MRLSMKSCVVIASHPFLNGWGIEARTFELRLSNDLCELLVSFDYALSSFTV